MKNRLTKLIFGATLIVAVLGVAGAAYAAVTISATTVSSSGALTLTGATASTWSTTVGAVTIQSGDDAINLTAVTDVVIPANVGITFAGAEKIESNGTDLTFTVGAGGDINIGTDIGLTFGDAGEKIEGDGTDLTITGNNINLTATSAVTVVGDLVRTAQQYVQSIVGAKVGSSGVGWVIEAGDSLSLATLPASQTSENMVIPVTVRLKVGETITAFSVIGQIESGGGAVTLDADLRKHTAAAADVADVSVGTIDQVSVSGDAIVSASKTGLTEVVAADETFYIVLLGTTAASTDIAIQGITITVTEK